MALSAGGPKAYLPKNFKAPWGFSGHNKVNAMWVGEEAATDADVAAAEALGWTVDEATLVGIHDKEWTAKQYAKRDMESLDDPWDFYPQEGGEGSLAYQMQNVPEGIDRFLAPRKWVHHEGKATRSKGGEPAHKVHVGTHSDWHLGAEPGSPAEGLEFEWNNNHKLWEVK